MLTCSIISATVIIQRKTKAVRQKSVKFIILALIGCLFIVLTPFLYVQKPSTLICNMKMWLPALGMFIIHVALISRELLISSIFNEKNIMKRRSMWIIYKPVIIFGSIFIVFETVSLFREKIYILINKFKTILLCYSILSRPYATKKITNGLITIICKSNSKSESIIIYALASFHVLLVIFLFIQAIMNRKVLSEYQNTNHLILFTFGEILAALIFFSDFDPPALITPAVMKQVVYITVYGTVSAIWIFIPVGVSLAVNKINKWKSLNRSIEDKRLKNGLLKRAQGQFFRLKRLLESLVLTVNTKDLAEYLNRESFSQSRLRTDIFDLVSIIYSLWIKFFLN
jgi:hypothetical protein